MYARVHSIEQLRAIMGNLRDKAREATKQSTIGVIFGESARETTGISRDSILQDKQMCEIARSLCEPGLYTVQRDSCFTIGYKILLHKNMLLLDCWVYFFLQRD